MKFVVMYHFFNGGAKVQDFKGLGALNSNYKVVTTSESKPASLFFSFSPSPSPSVCNVLNWSVLMMGY